MPTWPSCQQALERWVGLLSLPVESHRGAWGSSAKTPKILDRPFVRRGRRVHHGRDGAADYNEEIIQRLAQIEPLCERYEGSTLIVWTLVFGAE
jgi:hypothetical protein